jgi:UDP-N-acetylglucosamine:LPS N-acetylglucosamine transferase
MVGLALALLKAGNEVIFATGSPVDGMIRRDGFDVETAGLSEPQILETRRLDATYTQMITVPRQGRMAAFTRSFAAFEVPPRVSDLRRIVQRWRPDLIVHESAEFAGPLVGTLEGLPSVNHSFGLLIQADVMARSEIVAGEHWQANGLPKPDRGGMYRGHYLDIAPPSLQLAHVTTIPLVQRLRPIAVELPATESPQWMSELGSRPVVTVTFGTVFNDRANLYRAVIEGLGDIDADVVVATGRWEAAKAVGAVPANIQLRDWVPWASTLQRSSVVVSHGGASSTLGPLSYGLPLVIVPMAADHFTNADAAEAAGAATVLDLESVSPAAIRDAVEWAFSEPAKSAALRIAQEIAEMPQPEAVVPVLTRIAGRAE